ncbi:MULTISPECIES: hypothetical protein [unclassified Ensifer]|uniref:hypothetical protein n=1 Tax=unclassified Ensifer TaxID=2633371 RepID=UPI0012E3BDB4|nr:MULTISPECIES: hypothetical protein [unclassified Ensifer]
MFVIFSIPQANTAQGNDFFRHQFHRAEYGEVNPRQSSGEHYYNNTCCIDERGETVVSTMANDGRGAKDCLYYDAEFRMSIENSIFFDDHGPPEQLNEVPWTPEHPAKARMRVLGLTPVERVFRSDVRHRQGTADG